MTGPLIRIGGLRKGIGGKPILKGVDLEVQAGKFLGVVGPNGAGKTTLLKAICGLLIPGAGEIEFDQTGRNNTVGRLEMVGSLLEKPDYFGFLSAHDILRIRARLKGFNGGNTDEEIHRVSKLCGIESYLDRRTRELSTGMRQKVALASAFIGSPKLLILDEPLSGIDIYSASEILDILSRVREEGGTTAIVTFHEMDRILDLMDQVAFMIDGRIVEIMDRDDSGRFLCVEHRNGQEGSPGRPDGGSRVEVIRVDGNYGSVTEISALKGYSDVSGVWECNPISIRYGELLSEYYSGARAEQ